MAGVDDDKDAVGKAAIGDDHLPVGAVGSHRMNATGVELEHNQPTALRRELGLNLEVLVGASVMVFSLQGWRQMA